MSHVASENSLKSWFAAKEEFLIIIYVKISFAA